MKLALLKLAALLHAADAKWPINSKADSEHLPNLELSLAAPVHPWPQVAAEIGNLEASREQAESASAQRMQKEFKIAQQGVMRKIGDLVGRTMKVFDDPQLVRRASSFREAPQEKLGPSVLSVKVQVVPASPPDPSLRATIENMESTRSAMEARFFKAATADLQELQDFILDEAEVQLQRNINEVVGSRQGTNFRQLPAAGAPNPATQLPEQANVRVLGAGGSWPTVASMATDMEAHRDLAELLERKKLLEQQVDFASAANGALKNALKASVSRILAQQEAAGKQLRIQA